MKTGPISRVADREQRIARYPVTESGGKGTLEFLRAQGIPENKEADLAGQYFRFGMRRSTLVTHFFTCEKCTHALFTAHGGGSLGAEQGRDMRGGITCEILT